ncbi:glucose-1-phosphate thymidylyltransferase [Candidatus Bathyarchaeota archaeon RBG_13_38_9]|nr:MAG: glucose-1-phosphate thymidylyltransferase [Candidatus Bathyarchaeota archaeon RBG_13_38_9]
MKGLLLAGGHGTRLRPLTFTGNKHMLPIANKPMILYGLEHLVKAGINEIGVILGPIKEDVKKLLGDGSKFGASVTYIDQPEPKGLAHTIMISKDFLGDESFAMYLGDNMLKQGAKPLVEVFKKSAKDCVVAVAKVKDPSSYGIAVFDEDGKIKRLVEKPKEPISDWALVGVYIFNNKIHEVVRKIKPSWRGELEITDAIQHLIDSGANVEFQFVQGWWKDTGKPEDLLEANQLVLQELQSSNKGKVEEGAIVSGIVNFGKDTIIHRRSTIRGPVILGENCEIGPDTYIGPYTSIGNGVTIKNSEIENSIVMDNAHIACGKRIIDSLIGMKANVVCSKDNIPSGVKLILGDMTYVGI